MAEQSVVRIGDSKNYIEVTLDRSSRTINFICKNDKEVEVGILLSVDESVALSGILMGWLNG